MITQTINVTLQPWPDDEIALITALNHARRAANAIETGTHASQDCTYGKVEAALVEAIATAIYDHNLEVDKDEALIIAARINDSEIDNYEGVLYQVDLWNSNVITVY